MYIYETESVDKEFYIDEELLPMWLQKLLKRDQNNMAK